MLNQKRRRPGEKGLWPNLNFSFREECRKFDMPEPQLILFENTNDDLLKQFSTWSFFDEFHSDLNALSKEDWILFRGKSYKFEEFLSDWEKKVEERETTPVMVRMLQEINSYKVSYCNFSTSLPSPPQNKMQFYFIFRPWCHYLDTWEVKCSATNIGLNYF